MAGSPLRRQRKLGVRQKDGSIIAFPYMPRVADLKLRTIFRISERTAEEGQFAQMACLP